MPKVVWIPAYLCLFCMITFAALVDLRLPLMQTRSLGWWWVFIQWYYALLLVALIWRDEYS